MKTKPASGARAWSDPDDAPTLTKSFFARAEIRDGEKLVRPSRSLALAARPRCASTPTSPTPSRRAAKTGRRARTPPSARRSRKPPPDRLAWRRLGRRAPVRPRGEHAGEPAVSGEAKAPFRYRCKATRRNKSANSLSVIASEAKQSRGRSTTVWVAGALHVVAPGLLRRKGSSQ